jgi:hypothetical protein
VAPAALAAPGRHRRTAQSESEPVPRRSGRGRTPRVFTTQVLRAPARVLPHGAKGPAPGPDRPPPHRAITPPRHRATAPSRHRPITPHHHPPATPPTATRRRRSAGRRARLATADSTATTATTATTQLSHSETRHQPPRRTLADRRLAGLQPTHGPPTFGSAPRAIAGGVRRGVGPIGSGAAVEPGRPAPDQLRSGQVRLRIRSPTPASWQLYIRRPTTPGRQTSPSAGSGDPWSRDRLGPRTRLSRNAARRPAGGSPSQLAAQASLTRVRRQTQRSPSDAIPPTPSAGIRSARSASA